MIKKKMQKVCSKCGSNNLKIAITPWKASHGVISGQYKCMNCGFEGIPIIASEKSGEKIRKELEGKRNKEI